MSIEVKNVSFSYGSIDVLHGVNFTADSGDLVAVLGPNGVGKSTFFRCMLGFLKPREGEVLLNGKDIYAIPHADVAKEIADIPQSASPAFNYTVLDTVLMGMTNQIGTFSTPKKEHRDKALAALESLGIADLAGRGCSRISGGERQLVLLARSLVQDAKILIMDEPTANLDYGNSFRVMQRIETLGAAGYTVIFSTHEPNQAFRYANRVLALSGGRVLTEGVPAKVLTEETLSALYRIGVAVRGVEIDGAEVKLSVPKEQYKHLTLLLIKNFRNLLRSQRI